MTISGNLHFAEIPDDKSDVQRYEDEIKEESEDYWDGRSKKN